MLEFSKIRLEDTGRSRNGRKIMRLRSPLTVKMRAYLLYVIPAGFESDGLSRPFFLGRKWESWGRYSGPALLHDYLLEETALPKWQVDWLFMGALRSCGVSALESGLFWLAVRTKRSRL